MRIFFKVFLLFLFLMTTSCKSKKVFLDGWMASPLSANKMVETYEKNMFHQNTIKARINVDYDDGKNKQNFIANLRMEKDKTIWITVTVFGIPIVKALITPEKVSYYEKINGTYFEGDFTLLSNWLGTPLDFEKIQNLLLGQALSTLKENEFDFSIDEKAYLLKQHTDEQLFSFLYWINPQHFKLDKQLILNPEKEQYLSIVYNDYHFIKGEFFPKSILINAVQQGKTTNIQMDYKIVEFNEILTFPYEIPNGFKRLQLN